MANETATKSKRFYCISLVPDICKTPMGSARPPIPYSVIGEFSDAADASPNVKSRSEAVILHQRSVIPSVKGDEPGKAGGIKSGTFGKRVETKTCSATYHANGTATVQEGCEVWMNNRNTVGKIYERGGLAPRSRLQQIRAMLEDGAAEAVDAARDALKPYAQDYKDKASESLHQFGANAMDAGGKIALGSTALAGAGVVAGATVVGAPAAVVMEAGAAAGATVSTAVIAAGAGAETMASVLDQGADYVLTGKPPAIVDAARELATRLAEGAVMRKLGPVGQWLTSKLHSFGKPLKNKHAPGKKLDKPTPPRPPNKTDPGGRTSKRKQEKSDAPSNCCPQNTAPGGKRTSSKHPVHFGTGEEVLHQTDFTVEGPNPLVWTRCYRSGAETQDWGLFGARWSSAFTTSLSVTGKGIVYHDDSGRALRLPALAAGQSFDSRKEGFILTRSGAMQFTLTWRDGGVDTFERDAATPDGWLPHGDDGVNAMRAPSAPFLAERYTLRRSAGRDGRGVSIELLHKAGPGKVLLRVRSDDGAVIEAIRDDEAVARRDAPPTPPRIARIEEVRADGTRVCHARYTYEKEAASATGPDAGATAPRHNLVRQTNLAGDARTYAYRHHLLTGYTTYSGFTHGVQWTSQAALRERWSGSALDDTALRELFPITLANSYQARAIATTTGDGADQVGIAYLDMDTTRVSEANGGVLDYTFDDNWLAVEVRRVAPEGGPAVVLGRRDWDRDGMLLADVDAAGRSTRYSYDAAGNLTAIADALGYVTRFDYDAGNLPVAITDALGHTTRHSYDSAGRLAATTDALGHTTTFHYGRQGRLAELVDAKGGRKTLAYDDAGRLRGYTDCSGYRTAYDYDAAGRLNRVTDALDQKTRYDYDALGRLASATQPDGAREQFAYDAEGRLLSHTDARGHQTRYAYNGHGLPTQRTDALGQTLRYRYDQALQLVELVNASGESYHFTHDIEGRLTSETGFDGKTTTYTYDGAGELTASESRGRRTELTRDKLGRLLAKHTADGVVRYAHDALGRLVAVAAPHAEQRFLYDALGQLLEERSGYRMAPGGKPGDAFDAGFAITHGYDELGNRIHSTLPNGRRVDTLRYGSGHWHGTLWQGATVVDIARDRLHRETTRQLGDGAARLSATRRYDKQSRVAAMALTVGDKAQAHLLRERRFSYDPAGNLTGIEQSGEPAKDALATFSYTYDPLGQLLSAVQPGLRETFAFDPAGNLLDVPEPDGRAARQGLPREPVPAAALAPITHNLLKAYRGIEYDYDEHGNVIRKSFTAPGGSQRTTLDLAYDAENRLIRTVRRGYLTRHTSHYLYDAFSRRIAKSVTEENWTNEQSMETDAPASSAGSTTLFVWDGDVMAQELRRDKTVTYLYEPDGFVPLARIESKGGFGTATDELQAETAKAAPASALSIHLALVDEWGMPSSRTEEQRALKEKEASKREEQHQLAWAQRLSQAESAAKRDRLDHYNCDHLGTPRELVNDQGRIVWRGRFKVWGRAINFDDLVDDVQAVEQPLRFQGQYEDAETGLHYNRYRYYDPDVARYITRDPIGILGGLNRYAFSRNPTGWIDPVGLTPRGKTDPSRVDRDCRGRFRDHLGQFAKDPGWPQDRGFFEGKSNPISIQVGTFLDRYGYPGGTFVSPAGVPFEQRALPSSYKTEKPYYIYEVMKPITAQAGLAAPWFKQIGFGIQYELSKSVQDLIKDGSLRDVTPCNN